MFGDSQDLPQIARISDESEVKEYLGETGVLHVGQGEMFFLPTSCESDAITYGLSRCTALAGFGEKGRILIHSTENDSDSIDALVQRIRTQFPDMDVTVVVPFADPNNVLFNSLHPESQALDAQYIEQLEQALPGVTIQTYPCSDVTPKMLDQLEAEGGIPETAVELQGQNIRILSTRMDGAGNVTTQ